MSSHAGTPIGDSLEEVITARVAAREKGVHPVSIYRAIKEGRLKGSRSGHTILIRRGDLAAWQPVGHRRRNEGRQETEAPSPNGGTAAEAARLKQIQKNQSLVELLRKWREEGDEQEQREAFEALKQTLDEDRLSDREIYPGGSVIARTAGALKSRQIPEPAEALRVIAEQAFAAEAEERQGC